MRTATWFVEAGWLLVPRLMMVGLVSAMLQVADTATCVYGDDGASKWLKVNENGEPCEVTLADGTTLKLDTYGEEYEVRESRPPIDASEKGQTVFDYEKARLGTGIGGHFLRLDVEGGRMYWIEIGPSNICNVRSAALNGQRSKLLVDLQYQSARGLAIDHERRVLYWGNHASTLVAFDKGPSARQAIWKAGLDGSAPDPLFGGLREPGAVAVDPQSGTVLYFDGSRLVRGDSDGTNETVLIKSLELPRSGYQRAYKAFNAAIDAEHGKIYWSANSSWIACANTDGTGFEIPFDGGNHIGAVALDPRGEKMYWIDIKSKELWKANLNGSQPEAIAIGLASGSSMDVDTKQGYIYWTDSRRVRTTTYGLIRKLKLPAPLATHSKPAPPLVTAIEPGKAAAGQQIMLRGKHLFGAKRVRLIGNDGRQSDAKVVAANDAELTLVVPPQRVGVTRAAVVVQGPGGVTVTLPREVRTIKRSDAPSTNFDRFQDSGDFCFAIEPAATFAHVERSLVYVSRDGRAFAGGRGHTVLFMKNGSGTSETKAEGTVIYHEPFAQILSRKRTAGYQYIPVPAIRPSFVESLFQYTADESMP